MKMEMPVMQGLADGERASPSAPDLAIYRRLAIQLNHDMDGTSPPRSVIVAGPTDALASSHASIALAGCMGEELRQRILLVDASPEAEITRMMGCSNEAGFSEMLHDPELAVDGLLLATTVELVKLLPAGILSGQPRRHAAADPAELLRRLQPHADILVLAAGSVLNGSAALALAPFASSVVLVPIEDQTLAEDLDAAHESLRMCKARRIGILMASAARARR